MSRLSDAFALTVRKLGLTATQVSVMLDTSQQNVSNWMIDVAAPREGWVELIEKFEEKAGLFKGTVLREAGYVADPTSLLEAIAASGLEERDKENLTVLYEAARARVEGPPPKRTGRQRPHTET